MIRTNFNYLSFIPFTNFDLWDTKRYTSKSISSTYPIVTLGSCIKEESKKYKIFLEEEKDFGILGVNNKEGIFDAYLQKGKEINQPYKKMEVGWLAYNPYRINVGSIGVRKEEHKHEYISPAYVVFSCLDNLLPEYLFLLFKTNAFNKVINENTTGSVRQNLTIEILKKLEIPLPSLEEQEQIVNTYYDKIQQADLLEEQAKNLGEEIERYFLEQLGLKPIEIKSKRNGLNTVEFKDVLEWGTDKIMSDFKFDSKIYKLVSIGNHSLAIEDVFRGKSPKYAIKSNKFILNQKCNRWNKIEIGFAKPVIEEWYNFIDGKFFTKEGDVIVNSTGEGTIGRSSYITKDFEGLIYDSHILLLRLNSKIVNPELFVELFNSSFGQTQVEEIKSAQATKQTELGVNNLLKIKVPVVPDLKKQQIIVDEIKRLRKNIEFKTERAVILKQEAEQKFEKTIFN